MYAIVRTGGKQYKVSPGDIISVEKIEGNIGDAVILEDILMVSEGQNTAVGRPVLGNAQVTGEIISQGKLPKVIIHKSRKRKGYQKKTGHRQPVTRLKIKEIHYEMS